MYLNYESSNNSSISQHKLYIISISELRIKYQQFNLTTQTIHYYCIWITNQVTTFQSHNTNYTLLLYLNYESSTNSSISQHNPYIIIVSELRIKYQQFNLTTQPIHYYCIWITNQVPTVQSHNTNYTLLLYLNYESSTNSSISQHNPYIIIVSELRIKYQQFNLTTQSIHYYCIWITNQVPTVQSHNTNYTLLLYLNYESSTNSSISQHNHTLLLYLNYESSTNSSISQHKPYIIIVSELRIKYQQFNLTTQTIHYYGIWITNQVPTVQSHNTTHTLLLYLNYESSTNSSISQHKLYIIIVSELRIKYQQFNLTTQTIHYYCIWITNQVPTVQSHNTNYTLLLYLNYESSTNSSISQHKLYIIMVSELRIKYQQFNLTTQTIHYYCIWITNQVPTVQSHNTTHTLLLYLNYESSTNSSISQHKPYIIIVSELRIKYQQFNLTTQTIHYYCIWITNQVPTVQSHNTTHTLLLYLNYESSTNSSISQHKLYIIIVSELRIKYQQFNLTTQPIHYYCIWITNQVPTVQSHNTNHTLLLYLNYESSTNSSISQHNPYIIIVSELRIKYQQFNLTTQTIHYYCIWITNQVPTVQSHNTTPYIIIVSELRIKYQQFNLTTQTIHYYCI